MKLTSAFLGLLAMPLATYGQLAPNIALGARCTFDPAPNYALCTDSEDNVQLTDGKRVNTSTDPRIWAHTGAVGWNYLHTIPVVTIDLGSVRKISGARYSTAAGAGGVCWPKSVSVLVSDDNQNWRMAGDLVKLDRREKSPLDDTNSSVPVAHRYFSDEIRASGRYVAIAIQPQQGKANFVFCDEIEIYAGDGNEVRYEAELPERGLAGIRAFMAQSLFSSFLQERLTADANEVTTLISKSSLPARDSLLQRLENAKVAIGNVEIPDPDTFKTVFPFNALHKEIYATYGAFLQASGLEPLIVTKQHRYHPTERFFDPKSVTDAQEGIRIEMMRNEVRHDAFLLTNSSENPMPVTLRLNMPDILPHLKVSFMPWTDTLEQKPVAAAVPFTEAKDGAFHADLPAGLTTKVWLSVNSASLPSGQYEGTLEISNGAKKHSLPFALRVSPLKMNRPRLSCGMWDYTHPTLFAGLTQENVSEAIALMESHGIDTSWAMKTVLPWPEAGAFDAENKLVKPLDFRALETWIKERKDARRYFVFANVGKTFGGAPMNTPQFEARVGEWVRALTKKLGELNVPLDKFALQLVDEPKTNEQDEKVIAWAKPIRKANADLRIFQNPTWLNPHETERQEAITLAHIINPYAIRYEEGGAPVKKYFEERREAGQSLWFYLCDGPVRHFDPTSYYRNFAWYAFGKKADGINFWAFGDTGGGKSSWNEYTAHSANFSPLFFTPDSVTDAIHFTAIQEGIADHELLSMINDRLETSKNKDWREEAERFLTEASTKVLADKPLNRAWNDAKDGELTDIWRLKALHLLERAE